MANKIILLKSSVAAKVPLVTDLDYGELALNYADGKLYFKTAANLIKSFTLDDSTVTLAGAQTLTNKTLTAPTINDGALSGTFSGVLSLSDTTASTSTTTGALKVAGGLGVSGAIYADQIRLTNNGSGTNVFLGDDVKIGDINQANSLGVYGIQDSTKGYIVFGSSNSTAYIGRDGINPITVTGQFAVDSGTVTGGEAIAFQIKGYANKGGTGYHDFLKITNSYASATNPNKFFRLNSTGNLEIINSAYTSNIFTLTDAGALMVPMIMAGGTTGTSGQVLQSTGTGLQWATVSAGGGSGTVTSIIAGTGLSGGTISTTGTIALANTAVTAGSYTRATITVDAQGRITAASSNTAVTSIVAGTGLSGGTITSTGTIALANTAVTAGSYTSANITVDAQGRITAASSGSGGSSVSADATVRGTVYAMTGENNTSPYNVALGYGSYAGSSSSSCVYIGYKSTGNSYSNNNVMIGYNARNTSNSSGDTVGIGYNVRASSYYQTIVGSNGYGYGDYVTAIGYNANIAGGSTISVGSNNYTNFNGTTSIMIGNSITNNNSNSIILNASGSSFNPSSSGVYITSVTSATSSNILYYDTSTNKVTYGTAPTTTAPTLATLSDVQLSSPTTGQLLQYNGTKWVNATVSTGGTGTTTVTTTTAIKASQLSQMGSDIYVSFDTGTTRDTVYNIINALRNIGASTVIAGTTATRANFSINPATTMQKTSYASPNDIYFGYVNPYLQSASSNGYMQLVMTGDYNSSIGAAPITNISTTSTTIAITMASPSMAASLVSAFPTTNLPYIIQVSYGSNLYNTSADSVVSVAASGSVVTFTCKAGSISLVGSYSSTLSVTFNLGNTTTTTTGGSGTTAPTYTTVDLKPTAINNVNGNQHLVLSFSSAAQQAQAVSVIQAHAALASTLTVSVGSGQQYANINLYSSLTVSTNAYYSQYDVMLPNTYTSVYSGSPYQYGMQFMSTGQYNPNLGYSALQSISYTPGGTDFTVVLSGNMSPTALTNLVSAFSTNFPYVIEFGTASGQGYMVAANSVTAVASSNGGMKITVKSASNITQAGSAPFVYINSYAGITTSSGGSSAPAPITTLKKGMYVAAYNSSDNYMCGGWINSFFGSNSTYPGSGGSQGTLLFTPDTTAPYQVPSQSYMYTIRIWTNTTANQPPTGTAAITLIYNQHSYNQYQATGNAGGNGYGFISYDLQASGAALFTAAGLTGMTPTPYQITT